MIENSFVPWQRRHFFFPPPPVKNLCGLAKGKKNMNFCFVNYSSTLFFGEDIRFFSGEGTSMNNKMIPCRSGNRGARGA
jgi:hypothetical protein